MIFIYDGVTAFMEIKTKKGALRPIQTATISILRNNRIPVAIVRSKREALAFIKSVIERRKGCDSL